MNTITKWSIAALLLIVIFAAGCTKSMIEDRAGISVKTAGVMQSKPVMIDMDNGVDVVYETEPAMYDRGIMPYPEPMPPYYDDHFGSGNDETEIQIIRTAYMSLEVEDYFLASQKAEAYAKKYGGYVSSSDARADQNNKHSGTVTLRIPETHFDATMAELSLLGSIQSKSVNGNDVTEQYIDLIARKDNAEAHEARLVGLYADTTSVKDMMNVEQEISRVREEIERYTGQLRYLENRVSMSTITVQMHEAQPVVKRWGIWDSLKDALNNALATFRWVIVLLGWLLPLIVVGVVIRVLVKVLSRNKKTR